MYKRNVFIFGLLALFVIGSLFLSSCEEQTTENGTDPEDYLYNGIAVVETNNSNFEYIANDVDGNMVLYDWSNNRVNKAVCRDKNGNWVEMHYDEDGKPNYVYSEDYIVIIDNYSNGYADFAVIEITTGEISIYREVEFDIGTFQRGWYGDVADGLRFASTALKAFTVATGVIGLFPGGQASFVLAAVGLILTVITEVAADEFEALETSSLAFEIGAGAIGCSDNILDCIDLGNTVSAEVLDIIDENQEEIQSAEGILIGGYGDIQITLTWDNTADLDLYVTDPWGETIYYYNTTSSSGGWLDFDDIDGYGPENIFWENNSAPGGYYYVEVDYYSGYSAANFNVTITIGSEVNSFNGYIDINETVEVCSFYYGGRGELSFNPINIIKMREETKPEK